MIEVQDVGVDRPERPSPILDGITFRLDAGERVALLGGNGSGKTTLARLMNGTQLPSRGQVRVEGQDTQDAEARVAIRRAVGLLFQDPDDQFVTTTAEREIAFGLENLGTETTVMRIAVDGALREFDLEPLRSTPPHEMSGGEKARLALACVWVMQPRCLVLDETESLLDRRGREHLATTLARLPATTTILQVTTDAETAAMCPRVLVVHAGRLIADGPPDAVFAQVPEEVLVRVGSPLAWRVSAVGSRTTSIERLLERLSRGRSAASVSDASPVEPE